MVLQVVLVQDVVNEAGRTFPIVLRQRVGQCQMPLEILVLSLQHVVFIDIEGFAHGSCAVPEADLALGFQAF